MENLSCGRLARYLFNGRTDARARNTNILTRMYNAKRVRGVIQTQSNVTYEWHALWHSVGNVGTSTILLAFFFHSSRLFILPAYWISFFHVRHIHAAICTSLMCCKECMELCVGIECAAFMHDTGMRFAKCDCQALGQFSRNKMGRRSGWRKKNE